jgi:hypothetical protein
MISGEAMKYAGLLVAALYLIIGIVVLLRSNYLSSLPDGTAVPLGILLILYGLFRGYRVYQRYF